MMTRTSQKTVTFVRPFTLEGVEEVLPAGAYRIETDEEMLQGLSFVGYRRIRTLLYLPGKPGRAGRTSVVTIDPNDLDAALERDAASARNWLGEGTDQAAPDHTTQQAADRQAIQCGEDEGMPGHPR